MTDERRRILNLVADGKITVDDAERLLNALAAGEPAASHGSGDPKPRYLRINVKRKGGWTDAAVDEVRRAWAWPGFAATGRDREVNIRVPLALVRSGMRLGAMIPGLAGHQARLRDRGVDLDLTKLDPAMIESMLSEMGEMNIDIDSGKAEVRITCE